MLWIKLAHFRPNAQEGSCLAFLSGVFRPPCSLSFPFLGEKKINMLIHSRSALEYHTRNLNGAWSMSYPLGRNVPINFLRFGNTAPPPPPPPPSPLARQTCRTRFHLVFVSFSKIFRRSRTKTPLRVSKITQEPIITFLLSGNWHFSGRGSNQIAYRWWQQLKGYSP